MTIPLKPCPCGQTPERLDLTPGGSGGSYGYASGSCCSEWSIEFRTDGKLDSRESEVEAIYAWNGAPRAQRSGTTQGASMTRDECAKMIVDFNAEVGALAKARGIPMMYLLTAADCQLEDGSTEELAGRAMIGDPGRIVFRLAANYGQLRSEFNERLNVLAYRSGK